MPVVGYNKVSSGAETSSPCQERRSVFSVLFFNWITETFKTGNSRHLEESDLLPIEEQNTTKVLTEKLQEIWNDEREVRHKCGKRPRLWRCVLKMLPTTEVFILLVLGLVDTMFCILRPLLLGVILSNLINTHSQDKKMMYACAVLLGVVSVGRSFATHLQCWLAEVQGARLCSALKGIIYSKITRVEHQTLQQFREGQVIDLLSNDLQRLELAPRYFFDMIATTYFIPLVVYLFLNLFDWRALAGILFLLVIVLYFLFVSYLVGKLRWQTAHVTDKRIALMNELVSGIRAVKTHAWEQNYEERVKEIRRQEISKIRQKSLLVSTVEAIICCSSSIAVFLSALFLVLSDRRLTPVNAFMLLSFMNLFRVIVSTYLGKGLQVAFEAVVSLGRMRDFLLLEDLPSSSKGSNPFKSLSKDDTTLSSNGDISERKARDPLRLNQSGKNYDQEEIIGYEDSENALVVSNLSYTMNTGAENKRLLDDISFVTPRNSLTIICGQVGSGKSTLLSAIAGEVILSDGAGRFPGTLAYVPQVPWVFSGTIKENILFNVPFDPQWYFTVVEACGLREDIQLFPDEDDTIVGQRGAVLSGGQKARVSLARAVYSFADVYILDDPLSAVDQKVGDHIFEKCICDLLDKKIRVLASHHSSHLQKADQVIVLSNGRVQEKVKPQLRRANGREEVLSNTSVGEYQIKKDSFRSQSSGDKPNGLEIPEEDRAIGNVSFRLYWDYFKSGMHPVFIVALIAFFLLTQPAVVFPDVWLSYLSKQTLEQQQKMDNIVIYSSATAVSFGLAAIRVFLFFLASLRSSQQLHNKMVKAILHSQLLFFDTNPTGRILNRFSKDIGSMDEQLPQSFVLCIQFTLLVVTAVLLPAITNPWLLLVLLPTLAVFFLFTRYYLKTSRELKRLESICRSPVFSHFSETMAGLDTIRTRAMEDVFIEQFYRHQDLHNQAFYMVFESTRWFGLRVDLLCVPFVTCAALASVALSMDPAIAGLSLTYVMETVVSTQFTVRQFSDVENLMTSVERVMTYTNLESETGYKTSSRPSIHWPHDGDVIFRDVTMTYYEGGPRVLRNLNFKLEGESRIGVAGRTGAGKSSLVAALLRMPDVQGDIIIDGVRISDINLQESRRCIAVLGQVPVLFSGSLRRNLDPMNQHEDVHLWAALEDVRLKSFVENLHGQLNYQLRERGANLSVGERQLVCLARTLLKHNRIVILDEPTAHVDPVTEKTIWNTVHEKLKNCTVITIAHRLDTIKDCDMILVLRDGEVAEFGTFDSLVGRQHGVLAGIANISKYEKEKE